MECQPNEHICLFHRATSAFFMPENAPNPPAAVHSPPPSSPAKYFHTPMPWNKNKLVSKANFLPKVRAITLDLRVSPGGERGRELDANMIKLPVNMAACNGAMLTNLIMGGVIKGEEWVAEAFHLGTLALALWHCPPTPLHPTHDCKTTPPAPTTYKQVHKKARVLCFMRAKPVSH